MRDYFQVETFNTLDLFSLFICRFTSYSRLFKTPIETTPTVGEVAYFFLSKHGVQIHSSEVSLSCTRDLLFKYPKDPWLLLWMSVIGKGIITICMLNVLDLTRRWCGESNPGPTKARTLTTKPPRPVYINWRLLWTTCLRCADDHTIVLQVPKLENMSKIFTLI